MGVGKSAVSKELFSMLPNSAYLDGDWAWMINPFTVTDETKAIVMENCTHLLNSYIGCSFVETVIFSWAIPLNSMVFEIYDGIISKNIEIKVFTLMANAQTLEARLERDIVVGKREESIIKRSLGYLPYFEENIGDFKIDTNGKTPREIADEIILKLEKNKYD